MSNAKHLYDIIQLIKTLGDPRKIVYTHFQGNLEFHLRGGGIEAFPTKNFILRPEEATIMILALKQAFRNAKIATYVVLNPRRTKKK